MWTNLDFLSNVARAEAEVVAVESGDPNDPFRLYRPNVVFETAAGDQMNVAAADTYRPTEAGERLVIGYNPRNPTDVRLMDPRDGLLAAVPADLRCRHTGDCVSPLAQPTSPAVALNSFQGLFKQARKRARTRRPRPLETAV